MRPSTTHSEPKRPRWMAYCWSPVLAGCGSGPDRSGQADANGELREHLPAGLTMVINRIKRAQGHLDGGHRMLEEGRECEEVVGVGLAEVSDAECEVAQLDMSGRLTRRPLLRRRPKRRVGAHLGAATRSDQSTGRSR